MFVFSLDPFSGGGTVFISFVVPVVCCLFSGLRMVTNSRVVSEKGGWIPVGNKRINRVEAMNNTRVQFNNGNGPLFTLFIDNLPEDASNSWLKEFFSNYGVVIGTFIPEKRSKATGRKFGFVRYNCSVSADVAISKAHGLWCKDMKLFVKYASFTPYRHGNQINLNEGYSKGVDVVLSRGNNLDKGAIFNTLDASNKSFGQGPRKTFAQALCGDTSNSGVQKDQSITLIINPVGNEWLQRSAVAVMHNVVSMQSLKASFKLETGVEAHFRAMGGRSVLITFQSSEDRDSLIKVLWMNRWFDSVLPWTNEAASLERFVWLNCQGMPLNAWSTNTFKQIGEIWGYYISMEEDTKRNASFARGRVLVATKEFSKIEKWIKIDVGGVMYDVKVTEESSFSNPDAIGSINSTEKDVKDDFILKEIIPSEASEDDDKEDDVDALVGEKLQENSTDQVSSVGSKMDEEYEDVIPINKDTFMVPDSFGRKTEDSLSNCDSLIGDSSEDIESFEDTATARQLGNILEDIEEVADTEVGTNKKTDEVATHSDALHMPFQATTKGIKGKRYKKSINEILGYSRVNTGDIKGKGNKKKCVVLRSAVASAALSASISSRDINNRNRILLDEAQAIWEVDKLFGLSYDGDENEVISKIAELEAINKARAAPN